MNDSEKNAVLVLRIAQDLKVSEATIRIETVKTLYNLIIRQYEKIERLNIDLKAMRGAANGFKAEVEKLKNSPIIGTLCPMWKAEAVREFAEKLKARKIVINDNYSSASLPLFIILPDDIDKLLEEMGCDNG